MITAILSNGEFLSLILERTGGSGKFWKFLLILRYAISYVMEIRYTEWIVVLYNAKIHHSSITLKTMTILGFKIIFLPAYSLSLAPVELFSRIVKSEMKNVCIKNNIT